MRSAPVPITAMVEPAPASPPRCAAASQPSARPLMMVTPAWETAFANDSGVGNTLGGRVATAHDRQCRASKQIGATLDVQQRRRVWDFQQLPRIVRVGQRENAIARLRGPRKALRNLTATVVFGEGCGEFFADHSGERGTLAGKNGLRQAEGLQEWAVAAHRPVPEPGSAAATRRVRRR